MVKARNLGIDILCCFGVMMLLGVQYIESVGYFREPIFSMSEAVPIAARLFCLSGAMVLSSCMGYVLCGKKFSVGYYKILIRLVYVYLLCSIGALGLRLTLLNDVMSRKEAIFTVFQFTATRTGRIAGMYFALLIAAPFLNTAFNGLPDKNAKLFLLIVTAALSTLQPVILTSEGYLIPEWFKALFPVAGYFGGAFIKRYAKQKHHTAVLIVMLLLILASETAFAAYSSINHASLYAPWFDSMASLPCFGIAMCLLSILHSEKNGRTSVHEFFAGAAGGAMVALLLGDPMIEMAIPSVNEWFADNTHRFWSGIVVIPVIFIICTVCGLILQMPVYALRSALFHEDEPEKKPEPPKRKLSDAPKKPRPASVQNGQQRAAAPQKTQKKSGAAKKKNSGQPAKRAETVSSPQSDPPAAEEPKPMTVEDILGIEKKELSTSESIAELINKLSDQEES